MAQNKGSIWYRRDGARLSPVARDLKSLEAQCPIAKEDEASGFISTSLFRPIPRRWEWLSDRLAEKGHPKFKKAEISLGLDAIAKKHRTPKAATRPSSARRRTATLEKGKAKRKALLESKRTHPIQWNEHPDWVALIKGISEALIAEKYPSHHREEIGRRFRSETGIRLTIGQISGILHRIRHTPTEGVAKDSLGNLSTSEINAEDPSNAWLSADPAQWDPDLLAFVKPVVEGGSVLPEGWEDMSVYSDTQAEPLVSPPFTEEELWHATKYTRPLEEEASEGTAQDSATTDASPAWSIAEPTGDQRLFPNLEPNESVLEALGRMPLYPRGEGLSLFNMRRPVLMEAAVGLPCHTEAQEHIEPLTVR